jgi:hypothetical protein
VERKDSFTVVSPHVLLDEHPFGEYENRVDQLSAVVRNLGDNFVLKSLSYKINQVVVGVSNIHFESRNLKPVIAR